MHNVLFRKGEQGLTLSCHLGIFAFVDEGDRYLVISSPPLMSFYFQAISAQQNGVIFSALFSILY